MVKMEREGKGKDLFSPVEKFKKDLNEFKPDYLVLNAASTTLENDLSILSITKKFCLILL